MHHFSEIIKILLDKTSIELYDSDKILSKVHISINPESSNDFDEFDYFAPPGDFDEVRVEIINTKLSTDYKKLFIESRPKIINGQKFDLNIINHSNSQVTLKVKGLEKFKDNEVYIVNSRSHKYYNLKLSNVVNIKPSTTDNYFLLLGDDNFIKESNVNLLKRDFSLSQNYPNPFNPTTTIEYSLLRKSNVRLIIYNSIGEVIRQFLNNIQETGNYKIDFNGAYLPSGIYFYQLNAVSVDGRSNFHDVKKMLLIK